MPAFIFEVEYAKSGRSGCKKCKGKIDKDLVRVGFKAEVPEDAEGSAAHMGCSWHHFTCFGQAKGQAWFKKHLTAEAAEAVAGLDALKDEDRTAVNTLFRACRGEVPMPAAPAAAPQEATPTKASKKRKSKGDEEDDGAGAAKVAKAVEPVLTESQAAAIAEAEAKLASKNAAALGAMLAQNGLPKAGRKDELVKRAAESQVLGVPPVCDVCEKKKLLWSRETGRFSCPGFFDDEAKVFKRCKGPSAGAEVKRTPWESVGLLA
uniref:PARP-type domain-containing protein n=1 Tax=Alexandrium monilatum TaxID=311494 RepID=A0A7S4PSS4_9DINO|mmetsp:Transcript_71333/g.212766  ORF Transcript_71333/g.212766 Transcript_71333/m.212766 type:complete len:263 (+) Transcript_71333:70-858(+)